MNIQAIKRKGALIILVLGSIIMVLAFIVQLSPAGAVIKNSPTTLTVDYSLAVSYHPEDPELQSHSPEERNVLVITHQYSPAQILVFQNRNYIPVPGFQYSFDARNAERMDGFITSFLTRPEDDRTAPLTALFSVNWWLEGTMSNGSNIILDQGSFDGRLTESLESSRDNDKISGKTRMGVDFHSIDSLLAVDGKGMYVLEMKADINYTFLAHNGKNVNGSAEHTIFIGQVNYTRGKIDQINLYYPLNSVTENVPVIHPVLIELKQNFLFMVVIGGILIGASLLIILGAKKGRNE